MTNLSPAAIVATVVLSIVAASGMISWWWVAVPIPAAIFLVIMFALTFNRRLTVTVGKRSLTLYKGR
jgi:hypothetical protein